MLSLRLATRACGQREPFSDEAPVRSSRCQWGWACHPGLHPKHLVREEEVVDSFADMSSQVKSNRASQVESFFLGLINLTRAGSVFNTTRTDPQARGPLSHGRRCGRLDLLDTTHSGPWHHAPCSGRYNRQKVGGRSGALSPLEASSRLSSLITFHVASWSVVLRRSKNAARWQAT